MSKKSFGKNQKPNKSPMSLSHRSTDEWMYRHFEWQVNYSSGTVPRSFLSVDYWSSVGGGGINSLVASSVCLVHGIKEEEFTDWQDWWNPGSCRNYGPKGKGRERRERDTSGGAKASARHLVMQRSDIFLKSCEKSNKRRIYAVLEIACIPRNINRSY